jgi:hypothetical protein
MARSVKDVQAEAEKPKRMRPRRWDELICPVCGRIEGVPPGGSAACVNNGRHPLTEMVLVTR